MFDNPKNTPRTAFMSSDVELFNFMFSFNQKHEMGICVQVKNRTILNVDHVAPEVINLSLNSLEVPELWKQNLNDQLLNLSFNSWNEYNVGFGMKIWDNGEHYLKGGVKLKFLQGISSLYMYTGNVNYNFLNADTANSIKGTFDYGYSANIDQHFDANNTAYTGINNFTKDVLFNMASKLGFGGDIGFTYEYRPKWKDYKYDMDGKTNLWRRDKNKYLLKFDFAVNDIGGMQQLWIYISSMIQKVWSHLIKM